MVSANAQRFCRKNLRGMWGKTVSSKPPDERRLNSGLRRDVPAIRQASNRRFHQRSRRFNLMHHCSGQGPELCRAVISGFISRGCCAGQVFGGERESIIDPDFRLDAKETEISEIDAEGRGFGDRDFGWVWGGSDHHALQERLSRRPFCCQSDWVAAVRGLTDQWRATGAHECAPRTAAISEPADL